MELETSHYGIFKAVYNILKRLPKGSRKRFILLVLGMVCVAGFETLTLGSIALLASGVSDPETIKQSVYFINIQNYLNLDLFSTNRGLIMTLSVTVFCLVICRNALLGLITFASGRYAANINGYIGEIFLLGFLRLPYEWHLNQNSADLVTTINWRQFFGLFINTLLLALSDAIVVLFMLAILMIVEPAVSILVIIVIGMVAFLILRNVRGILDRIAKRCEILGKSINRYVTRALHGVKDVKVYGKEDFFVSDYNDDKYNLSFAAKDAVDMDELFSKSEVFSKVHRKILTNNEATLDNVMMIGGFLEEANIDDVVIIFIAGHGILDANYNYYFATANIDFLNPADNGMPYAMLESVLMNSKCRNKLLFMDTCHAGELDISELETVRTSVKKSGRVGFRSAGDIVQYKENAFGLNNTLELSKSLFGDLKKGTGATVISAAGGVEYAREGINSQNGLFTSSLLEGLRTRRADLNRDRKYTVSEFRKYISMRVVKLSNGQQVPTSREENLKHDFRIY